MVALVYNPRIGEPVEARRQIFDHAARLPSPLARNGRHLRHQQLDPPSCVNLEEQYFCHHHSESTAMTDAARAFRGFRFPAGRCKVLTPFSADGAASW